MKDNKNMNRNMIETKYNLKVKEGIWASPCKRLRFCKDIPSENNLEIGHLCTKGYNYLCHVISFSNFYTHAM